MHGELTLHARILECVKVMQSLEFISFGGKFKFFVQV